MKLFRLVSTLTLKNWEEPVDEARNYQTRVNALSDKKLQYCRDDVPVNSVIADLYSTIPSFLYLFQGMSRITSECLGISCTPDQH